ncbi:hypothetical protein [Streptomyces sp. NPDC017673]|uniref:hypothetical protein n=1 Tax=Streptomyces sp. NPDC017673 TaxID=3365005 RepID=UPI0037912F93
MRGSLRGNPARAQGRGPGRGKAKVTALTSMMISPAGRLGMPAVRFLRELRRAIRLRTRMIAALMSDSECWMSLASPSGQVVWFQPAFAAGVCGDQV